MCFLGSFFISILFICFVVGSPKVQCLLLILNSMISMLFVSLYVGFSWYSLLFCIIQFGGVFILLTYLTLVSPNVSGINSLNLFSIFLLWILIFSSLIFVSYVACPYYESSYHLYVESEFISFCMLCCVLLLGFTIISLVSSRKSSYYR